MNIKCHVYDIPGVLNMRDLGGYAAQDGRVTAKGRFIRSTALAGIDSDGEKRLFALGIDCVIDLRSSAERIKAPDVIEKNENIYFKHIPMFDYIQSGIAEDDYSVFPESMSEMYRGLLEMYADSIKNVFLLFASGDFGHYLFHCTAGKDRTGVTAMLLLGLAGIGDETIIEDYSYTEKLLGSLRYSDPACPDYLFSSAPQTMRDTLDYIREKYGGVPEYLSYIGIDPVKQDIIRTKLFNA